MRVTTKGRVTIPVEIREQLSIHAGTEVEFSVEGNVVRLVPATRSQVGGKRVVERLRGRASVRMTTDEIMALTRAGDGRDPGGQQRHPGRAKGVRYLFSFFYYNPAARPSRVTIGAISGGGDGGRNRTEENRNPEQENRSTYAKVSGSLIG